MYTSLNYGKIVYMPKQFSTKHCYKLYFITKWYCLCILILHNFYHFYLLSRKYWCNYFWTAYLHGNCCCPFTQSCLTLCNPMNCSTPGFPVLHHLPELAQTHVHWVSDAIQPSRPLSPLSPPTLKSFPASESFPVNQLFTSDGQSIGASASILPMDIQSGFPLGLNSLIFLQSKGLSRVFSSSTIWKHQFFGA